MLALAPRAALTWAAFGSYALVTGIEARRVARDRVGARAATVWTIFPVMHVAHGTGMATGLARYLLRPDWGPNERLPPGASDALRQPDMPPAEGAHVTDL